jgi:hypothetical protein
MIYIDKYTNFINEQYGKKHNVIFCDIHGVVVRPEEGDVVEYSKDGHMKYSPKHEWDPRCVELINRLIEVTSAKLVITSTLKEKKSLHFIKKYAKHNGVHVYDVTPNIAHNEKGEEIKAWIKKHGVLNFAIIDDNVLDIPSYYPDNFIQTNSISGITDKEYKLAHKILTKGNNDKGYFMQEN